MNDDSKPTIPTAEKPRDWHAVHLWQIQSIRDGLLILLIVGLIYLGDVLSIITVPLLVALMLAYLVEPVVAWLARTVPRIGRKGAVLLMMALLGLIGVGVLLGTVPLLVKQGVSLVRNADRYVANVKAFASSKDLPEWLRDHLSSVVSYLPDGKNAPLVGDSAVKPSVEPTLVVPPENKNVAHGSVPLDEQRVRELIRAELAMQHPTESTDGSL